MNAIRSWADNAAGLYTSVPVVGPSVDIGTALNPLRTLYATNVIGTNIVGDTTLAFNNFLESVDAAGTGTLNLLKGDATDNTVLNAKTGKVIKLQVNEADILSLSASALTFTPGLFYVNADTIDGADTKGFGVSGGGGAGILRGGNILAFGNEAVGAPGYVQLLSGNVANSVINNHLGNATSLWQVLNPAALVMLSVDANGELSFDATSGGGVTLNKLGKTLTLKAGANAKAGTFTATGAVAVSVATTAFVAGSTVAISLKTVGGVVGAQPNLVTATPGVGFDVVATAGDTSVYNWAIIDQA